MGPGEWSNNGPHMPWMLYRYIMGELLRVFALTATVLVMVVAFGAAIKPLAADDLVGPLQTAKYIMLAIVPMLQFALPFAAGFAATVVMHRMTNDNEILAASVSGISYRRILGPIAGLGVVLLIIMALLTQLVIPRFWASMERMIARDATRIVQSSIEKGVPVRFGNVQIHADRLMVQEEPPDTGATTRLILFRVVAAKLDPQGRIVWDVAARQAVVDVHRHEGQTYLKIALADTVGFDAKTGQLASAPKITPEAIIVPGAFRDDPRFMTQGQLLWLRAHPDEFGRIQESKKKVAESLRHLEVWDHIKAAIESTLEVALTATWGGQDRRLVVRAAEFVNGEFSNPGGAPIIVVDSESGDDVRRMVVEKAEVRRSLGATLIDPTLDLVLKSCEIEDLRTEGTINRREDLTIPNLSVEGLGGDDPSHLPYEELTARAESIGGSAKRWSDRLNGNVADLRRAIGSRLLRRYALSVTATLLLLLGATLAMWLRHSVPLVIYVWAFLPSVLDILLISSGDHMARSGLVAGGITLMWSGNILLMVLLAFVFMKLSRN